MDEKDFQIMKIEGLVNGLSRKANRARNNVCRDIMPTLLSDFESMRILIDKIIEEVESYNDSFETIGDEWI